MGVFEKPIFCNRIYFNLSTYFIQMTKIDFTTRKTVRRFTLQANKGGAPFIITLIGETRNETLDILHDILKREYDMEFINDVHIVCEEILGLTNPKESDE